MDSLLRHMDHKSSKLLRYNVWEGKSFLGGIPYVNHKMKINFHISFGIKNSPHYSPLPFGKIPPPPGSCMFLSDVKEFGPLRHLCQNLSTICCSPYNFLEREIFNFCAQSSRVTRTLNVLFYCL